MKTPKILALGLFAAIFANVLGNQFFPSSSSFSSDEANWTNLNSTDEAPARQKKIKVALILDTSNSMDGLIDQAKSQLWNIVNELAKSKVDNYSPELQIALYQYGNSQLAAANGFIRQETPFTTDLDLLSEKLFSLKTQGGAEYCGQSIQNALNDLNWETNSQDYKVIFIAGNEPFNQGPIAPFKALSNAKSKDVFVNAIYCGDRKEGNQIGWDNPKQQGIGEFLSINSNEITKYIATPYDQEIADLNQKLNETYAYYGAKGEMAFQNMNAQDNNAAFFGKENMVNRALMKNGRFYNNQNASWDLVDKLNTDPNFKVSSLKKEELPQEMQNMSENEKQAYITTKQKQRAAINAEISKLGALRNQYLSQSNVKTSDKASLENAMLRTIHQQAEQKGFSFPENEIDMNPETTFVPALTNFDYFMEVAAEVKEVRKDRLVNFNEWLAMAKESNTIILDARGQKHYDAMHIKGAIHLDFAAFNAYDLARLIPDPSTRILLYCNNNIDTDNKAGFIGLPNESIKLEIQRNLVSKVPVSRMQGNSGILKLPKDSYQNAEVDPNRSMALNIPTFINLFAYGYKNVYELSELVKPNDPRLILEGTSIDQ